MNKNYIEASKGQKMETNCLWKQELQRVLSSEFKCSHCYLSRYQGRNQFNELNTMFSSPTVLAWAQHVTVIVATPASHTSAISQTHLRTP